MIHLGERQLRLLLGHAAAQTTTTDYGQTLLWACGCCGCNEERGLFELRACEYHEPLLALITPRADDYSLQTSEPFLAEFRGR